MKYHIDDRTLALAGIFQASQLVFNIARHGRCQDSFFESTLETLFKFDSTQVIDIFGSTVDLKMGLNTLIRQLSGTSNKQELEITRYVISLLHLQKKLKKNPAMLDEIAKRLKKSREQIDYFSLAHDNVIASLGCIYQDTISTLQPRILVQGEKIYLGQTINANKIRALLLAGIRCTVLWRQLKGNRLELLIGRNKYIKSAQQMLNSISPR